MDLTELIVALDHALTGRSEAKCRENAAKQAQFKTADGWLFASRPYRLCGSHAGLSWSGQSLNLILLGGSERQYRAWNDEAAPLLKRLREAILCARSGSTQ
jgi:hypothetical protein